MGEFSNHKCYINTKGVEVPSVTTIVGMLHKPALTKWANIMGFKRRNTDDILNRAGSVGTIIHDYMECYAKNETYDINQMQAHINTYGDDVLNRLYYIKEWVTTHDVKLDPIFCEESLTGDDYGGTVDFYGTYNGKKCIIDYKTSSNVYASMFLQLAGYVMLIEELGHEIEEVVIINIRKSHKVREVRLSRKEMEDFVRSFTLLKDFFNMYHQQTKKDYWKWGIIHG